ncbi:MAG: O-antigen ligase family protein [Candidatus Saccharibacteria bacterium]|nr:O-antigen ligase family protein [Candidatus Saccharibacteria bacterium]
MKKLFKILTYIFPAVLFFSYYPIITLAETETMHLELSLPLIFLVIFDLVAIVIALKEKIKPNKKLLWILPFPIFLTLSILWSTNKLRAVLTVGILWALIIAVIAIINLKKFYSTKTLKKSFIISTTIIAAWCWLQSILDIAGVETCMCPGCKTEMFGFPHPNGFAIEPQFMGNLLLAPTLYIIYEITKRPSKKLIALGFFFAATLFLTFSRGAIYSFVVALIFMLTTLIIKHKNAKPILVLPLVFCSFIFTLNMQGIFAEVSNTNDTFMTGISKSLNQLSLGIIDIKIEKPEAPKNEQNEQETESVFDGYVEESTEVRMSLTKDAVELWQKDMKTMLIGTGLGGAGNALFENEKTSTPKEIIQNEYASLLLEAGVTGIIFLILALYIIYIRVKTSENAILVYSVLVAFALSLLFFSGLPNALHIFIFPALLML